MGKILVIAEKPSVGRDIAKVLSCDKKADGYLFSDNYIISWAVGHLVALCDPEDYDASLKKWKYEMLPIIPDEIKLKAVKTTKKQLDILKSLMNAKDTDEIICATDSGREGELIFRYIYQYVGCKKKFRRLWISSMTDTAIKNGFNNLKDGHEYDNLYMSAKCRSEADWLVGINASRAFSIQYTSWLSIGRVQTPTLAIIVARQLEINAFVPSEYYELKAIFDYGGEKYTATWFDPANNETKIPKMEDATSIAEKITNQMGMVASVDNEEKKQPPPTLYDLTELQRDCNRKFGFAAKETLSLAQDLYEKRKLITYPRTDSRYLSTDMEPKLKTTLEKVSVGGYESYIKPLLDADKLSVTKRIIDNSKVTDHHAIIPTEVTPKLSSLSGNELKVYDLVVRRFISVFYPHYVYNSTRIVTSVMSESFLTKGTTVLKLGWMELYKDLEKPKKDADEEALLPNVAKGNEVSVCDTNIAKKKTEPPKSYTEATLLSAMENAGRFVEDEELKEKLKESGIGTPATRVAIIERIIEVGYIERKGKALIPTDKGIKLIQIVPHELKSPETTGKWEKGLSSVSKGKMEHQKFIGSIIRYVEFIVKQGAMAKQDVEFPNENRKTNNTKAKTFGTCPQCNKGKMLENTKAYYCSEWRSGCKITIWKDKLNGPLTEQVLLTYRQKERN